MTGVGHLKNKVYLSGKLETVNIDESPILLKSSGMKFESVRTVPVVKPIV